MMIRQLFSMIGYGRKLKTFSPKNVVFITGCDSGLGFTLALFCHSLNMTVISGCHSCKSEGAKLLQSVSDPKRMITVELDLLKQDTIIKAHKLIREIVENENDYNFTALVNNAGVMCFGEFEWQTNNLFESQINVNVLGTMRMTKELLPLIRQHRGRIINITSHCGLQSLPGLAPYAASKAALRFWNDSLRIELKKYGVDVVNFIPGSFVAVSNISARQQNHALEMKKELNSEQLEFYGDYFNEYNEYLKIISGFKPPNAMDDKSLLDKFKDAIANTYPRSMYIHEPLRYKIYRYLFSICPTPIVDWLTLRFCSMPSYKGQKKVL
ncbi:D-beta-hydroxybutyrate dehydrogenase, mitochondrial [Eupeodes corollae]|uniref:D-beta-hydroxybutyrate dehydrogenase, mitochondrial n=1 Tax=Eupeodes corollae TaxID=290404 RepID=UPI0024936362|nr:D-beta-hydroxybutyrate dehydrogenase, mitochondrial [Eupeodes corollae]